VKDSLSLMAKRLADLDGSMLVSLHHDLEHKTVALTFDHWDGREIGVACVVAIYCNVSVSGPEEMSEVIRATIKPIDDNLLGNLEKIGYLWKLNPEVAEEFEGEWLNLSITGDTSVEIVCREIEFQ
jgi:hypothetical protein